MTIAYCCLLIAGLLPYIAVGFAKSGGGYDNARGASLLSGGGRATLDIPVSDRLTVSPWFGGGGATGKVPTPQGDFKINKFDPQFGVGLNYKFD